MANTVIGASVEIDFKSVGNMRKALKEANQELIMMQAEFGDASKEALAAAEKVGTLKGQIKDAAETANLFDPSKKFQTFVDLGANIAAGFSAVQGAMALVGSESEDVQKALLKVQAAMALAQGLGQLKEFGESWNRMTGFINKATKNLSGFQKVLLGTGVGVLIAIVAYWEDIAKAIGLASSESENFKEVQEKSNSALADAKSKVAEVTSAFEGYRKGIISKEKALKIYNETLGDSLGKTNDINVAEQRMIANTENYLKSVQLKSKAQAAFAKSAELSVQLESDLAKGARESGLTIEQYKNQIKDLGKEYGADFIGKAQQEIDDLNKIANESFLEATSLTEKINAESLNKQFEDNEKLNKDNKNLNNEKLKSEQEYQRKVTELRQKAFDLQMQLVNDSIRQNLDAQGQELFDLRAKYNEQKKILEKGEQDTNILTTLYEKQKQEIIDKYAKEEKKKREEVENELNKINEEIRLLGIKDIKEKEKAELAISYSDQLKEIEANENYNAEQKAQFRAALLTKQKLEEDALNEKFRQEDIQKRSAEFLQDSANEDLSFADRLAKIAEREKLESQIIFENDKARIDFQKQNSDARKAIIAAESAFRIEQAQKTADVLQGLSDVVGKETVAGKALAVAAATINTYLAASKALAGISTANPLGAALAIAQAATVIGVGLKNVKEIIKVKVPGKSSGGGTAPNPPAIQTASPVTPQLTPAVQGQTLNAQAINDLGNTALRAYVMNSDIQNNDQRNAYLQRNARIG